jgi:polyphosphate kinase
MENKETFFNRELSWIEFNARVLHEGGRKDVPILERLQFLSIVSSNFDEFFQVRVAAIKRLEKTAPHERDASGLSPSILLKQISTRCHQITRLQHKILTDDILPGLAEQGITYIKPADFIPQQTEYTQNAFRKDIFPILTPLRTDTEEFPHIGNMQLHAAFLLKPMKRLTPMSESLKVSKDEPLVALVQIPSGIPRIIWLPTNDRGKEFTLIDDIIIQYGTMLFPGFSVEETMLFKVARDADFAVDEDSGSDFIHAMQEVLIQRQSSLAVRITCNNSSATILDILTKKLNLTEEDVYMTEGIMEPSSLLGIGSIQKAAKLKFPEWKHFYPTDLPADDPYWDILKQRDVLLHVPYESYQPVIKFISDAADDPDVISIKMTLYRTGRDSPIISALERAARNGKQVTVLVELKARFDEERNIAWASQLEKAGVIVIYGVVDLKVHAKILMIIRKENSALRRYVHLATGNYNPRTAKLYCDLSLFTTNEEIANDATLFFNIVTGYSSIQTMKRLSMAPVNLKSNILAMIKREIDRSTPEKPGLIIAKMNSLTHEEVINALYAASTAGVRIFLNIRGICMLVPGVPGMSEHIKVISIVGRYLEHERIFYFQNADSPELYLSSADWMTRNLDRRIELMIPILSPHIFKQVKNILDTYFADTTNSHILQSNGKWIPRNKDGKEPRRSAQGILYRKTKRKAERVAKEPKLEFKIRRKN